jgi:hypothetical protein
VLSKNMLAMRRLGSAAVLTVMIAACAPPATTPRATTPPAKTPLATTLPVATNGWVVGGIGGCQGPPIPVAPHYIAGTVTVLAGHATWRQAPSGVLVATFPPGLVATETVGTNGSYRFELAPGPYVLRDSGSQLFVNVTVHPGATTAADIANPCT